MFEGGASVTYPARVTLSRQCSRAACPRPAAGTLTYVYSDSTVVLGPLATYAEPHAYDLCDNHAARLTAPRGWDVVRLATDQPAPASRDDLVAIAEAVRARPAATTDSERTAGRPTTARREPDSVTETGRRGHLRVLRDRD